MEAGGWWRSKGKSGGVCAVSCSMYGGEVAAEVEEDVREVAGRLRVLTVQGMDFSVPALLARFPFTRLEMLYAGGQHRKLKPHDSQSREISPPCLPNLRHVVWLEVRFIPIPISPCPSLSLHARPYLSTLWPHPVPCTASPASCLPPPAASAPSTWRNATCHMDLTWVPV